MDKKILLLILVVVFTLGWITNSLSYTLATDNKSLPLSISSKEKVSPYDRVKDQNIEVYDNFLVIRIKDISLAEYTDTNSMDPIIDSGATGIEVVPKKATDIHVGDIIAYEANWTDGLVVHRVIDTGIDEKGVYFTVKGDNTLKPDSERVRFNQIKYITIGVLY